MPKLIHKTKGLILPGETITDFRGAEWKFLSLTRGGSRVYAEKGEWKQEFFPSVFDCTVEA